MNELEHFLSSDYHGAQWHRVDLHLHSPGSFSMSLPGGINIEKDHDRIVQQYVQCLVDQDVQIASITDYQRVHSNWFGDIQKVARQKGIVVYPGAELSFAMPKYGLHILAIFPLSYQPDDINRAIHALDSNPLEPLVKDDGTPPRDIRPKESIEQALSNLRTSTCCILIVAHPNDANGLLKSYRAEDAVQWLTSVQPDAIESFFEKDKQKLISTGHISQNEIRLIASVEFSDPKSLDEIGTKQHKDGSLRSTYVKLSIMDELRALRLAFHDPQILVSVGKKPEVCFTHFLGFEVEGNGFLGGLKLAFSPELNVLGGGRGVGKSAILETIRYILNISPFSPGEYRENLIQYALGSGGKANLFIEQVINPNVRRRYRFERVWGEETRIFEFDHEREVPLAPIDLLGDQKGPLYFGQREIFDVTRQDTQRLQLLDEITGRQARAQIQQVRKIEIQLRDNARAILERQRKLLEREEIEQRLKEIRHKIEIYRRWGLVEKLRAATALSSDEQRLTQVINTLEECTHEWRVVGESWTTRWESPTQILASAESSQKIFLDEVNQVIHKLQNQIAELFILSQQNFDAANQQVKTIYARWQDARRPLDVEIRKLKQELGSQSLDPDELIRLTTEQTNLEPLLRMLESTEQELRQIEEERRLMLNKLRESRNQVWTIRDRQAREITKRLEKRVEVKVEYKGQRTDFVEQLVNFFRGSGIDRKSLERLVSANPAPDGIAIMDKVCAGQNIIEEEYNLTPSRAVQICNFLNEDKARLFELQLLSPDDDVQVFLKLDQTLQPLSKLSDGQRATAMLLLLLVQEERLLIVDQPEDDLDNRFIYEDIVRILREQKGKRQLLAATHNPNIPVLGHAELIVALEASSEHTRIEAEGAIDQRKVQEFVRNVMEGGEDAFRRRAQKYGWI